MVFYRLQDGDKSNKILCNCFGKGCLLTIPWRAFIKLDPRTHSFVGQDVLLHMPASHYFIPRTKCYFSEGAELSEWAKSNCCLFGWMERDEIVGVYGVQTFICVDYKGSRYLRNKGLGFVEWPDDFSADSDTNSCTYEE